MLNVEIGHIPVWLTSPSHPLAQLNLPATKVHDPLTVHLRSIRPRSFALSDPCFLRIKRRSYPFALSLAQRLSTSVSTPKEPTRSDFRNKYIDLFPSWTNGESPFLAMEVSARPLSQFRSVLVFFVPVAYSNQHAYPSFSPVYSQLLYWSVGLPPAGVTATHLPPFAFKSVCPFDHRKTEVGTVDSTRSLRLQLTSATRFPSRPTILPSRTHTANKPSLTKSCVL